MLPWGIEGPLVFGVCPFPDESANMYQMCANRSSRMVPFLDFRIFDRLRSMTCSHRVSRGQLFLACVHSQMNPPTCTKCGVNHSSRVVHFLGFRMFDCLRPQKCTHGVSMGHLFLAYVHSQMNLATCTKCGAIGPAVWYLF